MGNITLFKRHESRKKKMLELSEYIFFKDNVARIILSSLINSSSLSIIAWSASDAFALFSVESNVKSPLTYFIVSLLYIDKILLMLSSVSLFINTIWIVSFVLIKESVKEINRKTTVEKIAASEKEITSQKKSTKPNKKNKEEKKDLTSCCKYWWYCSCYNCY